MSKRIAINGFGRIGRLLLRALTSNESNIEIIAINDLAKSEMDCYLLKYDSVHGRFEKDINLIGDELVIDNQKPIKLLNVISPEDLPWQEMGVDVVMECSGCFITKDKAVQHIESGAKKVLVSAPCSGADVTVVYGVNQDKLNEHHRVISAASCTTNCFAPIVKVLNENIGINCGHMTTIHSYTSDQNIIDTAHKQDMRRARAAGVNIIPTSTGAAKAIDLVLPEMAGKLKASSLRVPTPNVSLIDFSFLANKKTSVEEINHALKIAASSEEMKGVLGFSEDQIVSIDCNHTTFSAIFDSTETRVVDGKFCRVMAWYDNEWAFVHRMIDVLNCIVV